MFHYFVFVVRERGSTPTLVWQGDDQKAQERAYLDAVQNPAFHDQWIFLATRTFGRFILPPAASVAS